MRILLLTRAPQFSPNSVEKDHAIMMAVADRLRAGGHSVEVCGEADTNAPVRQDGAALDAILSMGRLPQTQSWLRLSLQNGTRVVNSPDGVELCCHRSALTRLMQQHHIPMPPSSLSCLDGPHRWIDSGVGDEAGPFWLKRGDSSAQGHDDVVFCQNSDALQTAIARFESRGVYDYVVSQHIEGDLVKFYGVCSVSPFFRFFYPTDDGKTKFGDEQHNGTAHHYAFDAPELQRQAERLAGITGVCIYGGDAIVRADGSFCIIDFNDWPSFSRCREEAAEAVCRLVDGMPGRTK